MIPIKFKMNNGDLGSYDFPLPLELIKEFFPNKKIELLENNILSWLKVRNHHVLNVYELNAFTRLYSRLNSLEQKKINALSSLKPKLTLNELMYHVIHQHCFALIDTFDDYNIPENLARELYLQHYPDGCPDELLGSDLEPEWIEDGTIAKETLEHTLTDYGWLFMLDKDLSPIPKHQQFFMSQWADYPSVLLTITNRQTKDFITLPLWLDDDEIEESLLRLDIDTPENLVVSLENIQLNESLFKRLEPLLVQSECPMINALVSDINNLDQNDVNCLLAILDQITVDDIGQLQMIFEALDDLELVKTDSNTVAEYAALKLEDLLFNDRDVYQDWIRDFLDYEGIGKKMLENETILSTDAGFLKVPESFSHFFDDFDLTDQKR